MLEQALFVTLRTVEGHLTQAYLKLGIRLARTARGGAPRARRMSRTVRSLCAVRDVRSSRGA